MAEDRAIEEYHRNKKLYLDAEVQVHRIQTQTQFAEEFQRWKEAAFLEYTSVLDNAETLMTMSESATKVSGVEYWNRKMLAKHCNLALDDRRLIPKDGTAPRSFKPAWTDVIKLTATLNNFKTKGFVSKKQSKNIDKLEHKLKSCAFDGKELRRITEALATKLGEEIEAQTLAADLSKHEELMNRMLPDLENCENMHEAALLNGDTELAEEIAYNQLALHEKLLDIIREQYPIIRKRQEDAKEYKRRRRWAIFRMANRDVNSVIELKKRQIEACMDDSMKIKYQMDNYATDDESMRVRSASDRAESDKFLERNKQEQMDLWGRMDVMIKEMEQAQQKLASLAGERVDEINRRVEKNEREESRRNGHGGFLVISKGYLEDLDNTVANARRAQEVCNQLNEFILDGCSNIAAKFDRTEAILREMTLKVNKQYLKQFTDYYLCVGRMLYRKENKMKNLDNTQLEMKIKLEQCIDLLDPTAKQHSNDEKMMAREKKTLGMEIDNLRTKMKSATDDFEPIAQQLREMGVPFVHPELIQHKANADRKEKVLDYRDMVNETDKKVAKQIEDDAKDLQHERELRQVKLNATRNQPRAPHPPKGSARSQHSASSGPANARYTSAAFQRYQQLCADLNLQSDYGKFTAPPSPAQAGLPPLSNLSPRHSSGSPAAATATAAPVPKKLPRRLEGRRVVAMYNYKSRNADELTFVKGDRIIVINDASEEGWLYGVCHHRTGMFPTNYVELHPDD